MWRKSCGHNYEINSIEKAYTLGFLWGDGHIKHYKIKSGESNIHYPSLEIVTDDMKDIIDLFQVWGNWKLLYRNRPNRRQISSICLFDKEFGWFLTENDYMIKSYKDPYKILSLVPEIFKQYWWRGFCDADGCFYKNGRIVQFSVSGSYSQEWSSIVSLFEHLDIRYQIQRIIHKTSKNSAIRTSNPKNVIVFGNYIYQDNFHIGLSRKYNKFNHIKTEFISKGLPT